MQFLSRTGQRIKLAWSDAARAAAIAARQASAKGQRHTDAAKQATSPAGAMEHHEIAAKFNADSASLHEQAGNDQEAKSSHLKVASSNMKAADEARKQGLEGAARAYEAKGFAHAKEYAKPSAASSTPSSKGSRFGSALKKIGRGAAHIASYIVDPHGTAGIR